LQRGEDVGARQHGPSEHITPGRVRFTLTVPLMLFQFAPHHSYGPPVFSKQ
jgi:hypothetical protein